MGFLTNYGRVLENIILKLMAVVLDNVTGASDRMSWGENLDGVFTVKSAYAMATRTDIQGHNVEDLFTRMWKVVVPERVRVFFWLVMHQSIMTNVERYRRHIADTGICSVCKGGEETILHVLRDCPAMTRIWTRIVPRRRLRRFFDQSLLEWIYTNLGENGVIGDAT